MEWANEDLRVYALADAVDGDDKALYRWWQGAGPTRSANRNAFPDASEKGLRAHVPARFRASCERDTYGPTSALASLRRKPRNEAAQFVGFIAFADDRDRKQYFDGHLKGLRGDLARGVCDGRRARGLARWEGVQIYGAHGEPFQFDSRRVVLVAQR